MALRIEDYAVIGDCETAALVGKDGSIDWLCWPKFGSGACFAALLGDAENGRWQIRPAAEVVGTSRKYREHTLILETTFEAKDGVFTLIDFMPVRGRHSDIVRIARGVKGQPSVRMELGLRFDYGRVVPWVSRSKRRPQGDCGAGSCRLARQCGTSRGRHEDRLRFHLERGRKR